MALDMGTLTPEQMLQQQQILRQQKMAEMLVQQGSQQPQGQMIGNRYVAPSFTQNLAGLANIYFGQRGIDKANQAQIDLAKQLRADESSAMADFLQQKQGRPAGPDTVTEMAGPYMGNIPMPTATMAGTPAVAGNPQAAYANLYANPKASAAQRQFAFTKMNEGPMKVGAEDVLLDPNTLKPIYQGAGKTAPDILTAAQMLGIRGTPDTWNPQQTAAVNAQVMGLKRAGATNVSVNAANKFAGGFGEKASGGAYDMYTAAQNAPQQIENAKRTIELVNSGALTGPAANIGLEAAKIFNVAGANNQDTISKTEQLFSNRGKAMLGSIKQSGLAGSQGLTEGERKFLTQAEGGTITLNADTLKAMAGLEIKMAVQNQKRWNQQASKMDKDILNATGAGPVEVYTGIGTIDANNPLLAPKL
jgi:hypothetical protein